MLDDFSNSPADGASLGRFSVSTIAAVIVFGGLAAAVVLSANPPEAEIEEDLAQVVFETLEDEPPPPEPEVEIPPPPPAAVRRGERLRPEIETPTEIPDEAPEEEEGELEEEEIFNPETEGDPDGVEGGRSLRPTPAPVAELAPAPPPPPPPPPPRARRGPVRMPEGATPPDCSGGNNRMPETTEQLRSSGESMIRVVARLTFATDGRVTAAQVLRGHPDLPDENVLAAVRTWQCTPATLNGEPISVIKVQPIVIRITL